jgi:two-component system, LytTR family, sensor histidine kinase AlgZ
MVKDGAELRSEERFLPDFCNVWTAFMLVLLSELLSLLLTLAAAPTPERFWAELGLRSFFVVWVALGSAMLLCLLGRRLVNMSPAAGGALVFTVVQSAVALAGWVSHSLLTNAVLFLDSPLSAPFDYFRNFAITAIVTAVWLRYLYMQYQWRLQTQAEAEARLDALQARMRPHFLFNSLNAIASLTRHAPQKAEELVLDLAELFRVVLKKNFRLATLEEEFQLTRQYLNIEKQRLGERLKVSWDVDSVPGDALIPPLSLQPLVENAVYHGIEPIHAGGEIEIRSQLRKGEIVLTVRNPLSAREASSPRQGNREAVQNLRLRLANCFSEPGQLFTSVVDDCYQARIVLPYHTRSHENPHRR